MADKSKTAAAADKAMEKDRRRHEGKVERTTTQIIADARKNYACGLAVTYDDQKLILAEYDRIAQEVRDAEKSLEEIISGPRESDELPSV
jgi:hypothetical protein